MRVSVVEVHPVHGSGSVRAVVNVILSGQYAVGPFRIFDGPKGLSVGYPRRQGGDGNWYSTFRPLSREARTDLDDRILSAYRNAQTVPAGRA